MTYDKDIVKENIDEDDVFDILVTLGGEPEDRGDYFVCKTICHGGDSRKLYYYKGTQLFKCYTHCDEAFDIFGLIQKVEDVTLDAAISYVVTVCNLANKLPDNEYTELTDDLRIFKRRQELAQLKINRDKIVLPELNENLIKYYPQPRILPWEQEHIPKEVCDYMDIHYDPTRGSIIIPHVDENGRLIGIRQRVLTADDEVFGKYRPWKYKNTRFNHPLAFNLYGLFQTKENINHMGKVIVCEAEKSALQIFNYCGLASALGVAVCGNSISQYQFQLLRSYGANEICIAFDADYRRVGDEDWVRLTERLQKLYEKFSPYATISFMFDRDGTLLPYKSSPTDQGKEVFMRLWRDRIFL